MAINLIRPSACRMALANRRNVWAYFSGVRVAALTCGSEAVLHDSLPISQSSTLGAPGESGLLTYVTHWAASSGVPVMQLAVISSLALVASAKARASSVPKRWTDLGPPG